MGYVDTNENPPHQYREVLFNFRLGREEPVYRGLTDDTTWNGWLVIWVDHMQLERLIEDAVKNGLYHEAEGFRELKPGGIHPDLYCLDGYTPVEVKKV